MLLGDRQVGLKIQGAGSGLGAGSSLGDGLSLGARVDGIGYGSIWLSLLALLVAPRCFCALLVLSWCVPGCFCVLLGDRQVGLKIPGAGSSLGDGFSLAARVDGIGDGFIR